MRIFSHPRFLQVYSAVLTATLVVGASAGFARETGKAVFDEIQVQRIKLVEPDGTVRMIVSNNARFPGLILKGKEYPHENRKQDGTAGMLFFDAEGTESGGLIFGGQRNADGEVTRFGHLSFDKYAQDEIANMAANQDGSVVKAGIQFKDEPDWPLEGLVKLMEKNKNQPQDVRNKILEAYMKEHGRMHVERAWLGRNKDTSSSMELRDKEGNVRMAARVGADGNPTLQFLDAKGTVVEQWPGKRQ